MSLSLGANAFSFVVHATKCLVAQLRVGFADELEETVGVVVKFRRRSPRRHVPIRLVWVILQRQRAIRLLNIRLRRLVFQLIQTEDSIHVNLRVRLRGFGRFEPSKAIRRHRQSVFALLSRGE